MRISKIEEKIAELSKSQIKLEARFDSLLRDISNIDKNVGKIVQQMDKLEEWKIQVHDNTRAMAELRHDFQEHCVNCEKIGNEVEKMKIRIVKWSAIGGTILALITFFGDQILSLIFK